MRQYFTLLTLALCLTVNVFAQKNTTIQPQVKSVEQPQSTVIMHTQRKELKPLYQQVIKNEAGTKVEKTPIAVASRPVFGSAARPNIYKNLDANIERTVQEIARLKADPNHDERIRSKHETNLERLQKIKAEKPVGY